MEGEKRGGGEQVTGQPGEGGLTPLVEGRKGVKGPSRKEGAQKVCSTVGGKKGP